MNTNNSTTTTTSSIIIGNNTDNLKSVDVKLSCKSQKRRFAISPLLTFRELMATVRSLLNLDPHQPLVLRYVDSEGDKVTMSSDFELKHALEKQLENGVLKLKVCKDKSPSSDVKTTSSAPVATLSTSHSSESNDDEKKKRKEKEKKRAKKEKKLEKERAKKDKKEKEKQEKKDKKKKKHGKKDESSSSSSSSSESEKEDKKKDKKLKKLWKRKEENTNTNNNEISNDPEKQRWAEKCFKKGLKKNEKCEKKQKEMFARFVQHVTIEDQTVLPPHFPFTKTWRMRNEGTEAWPANTELVFLGKNKGSERMGAPDVTKLAKEVLPGQEIDISVPLVSPAQPGMYFGYYRLSNPVTGKKFGQRVWVQIHVKAN